MTTETAQNTISQAKVFICRTSNDPNLKVVTINSEHKTVKLEETTAETHLSFLSVFRDGAFAPYGVGKTAGYCNMFTGNENVHQSVTIDNHKAIVRISRDDGANGTMSMDFDTGIFRSIDGEIAECRRAHP